MNDDSDEDGTERYQFDDVDRKVVSITRRLIHKVLRSGLLGNAQRSVVHAIAKVFASLPETTVGLNAKLSVMGPRWKFGDHEIYHWWDVEIDGCDIEVSASGRFYHPSTGGDTFTSFYWAASTGCETDCQDYSESIGIVDDAKPFGTEIDELDLSEPGYSIDVTRDGEEVLRAADDENDSVNETNEGEKSLPELTACLWAFMDADTRLIYALGGRAYSLTGTDEVKLGILRALSRHDFRSVQRLKIPDRFNV